MVTYVVLTIVALGLVAAFVGATRRKRAQRVSRHESSSGDASMLWMSGGVVGAGDAHYPGDGHDRGPTFDGFGGGESGGGGASGDFGGGDSGGGGGDGGGGGGGGGD